MRHDIETEIIAASTAGIYYIGQILNNNCVETGLLDDKLLPESAYHPIDLHPVL